MDNYSVNIVYTVCISLLSTYKVIDDASGWSQSMALWAINHSLPSSLQPGKWPFSRGLWVHTVLRRVCNWLMRKPHLRVGSKARKDTVPSLTSSLGLSPVEYDIQCQVWLRGGNVFLRRSLSRKEHANNPFSAEQQPGSLKSLDRSCQTFSKLFYVFLPHSESSTLCHPSPLSSFRLCPSRL